MQGQAFVLPCYPKGSPYLLVSQQHSPYSGVAIPVEHARHHRCGWVLQAEQKGVLIRRIEPTAPSNKFLKKGDILLSFDGVDIANDGTVPFRSGERISFNYLVSRKYTKEEVSLTAAHVRTVATPLYHT